MKLLYILPVILILACAPAAAVYCDKKSTEIISQFERGDIPTNAEEWASVGFAYEFRFKTRSKPEDAESSILALREAVLLDNNLCMAQLRLAELLDSLDRLVEAAPYYQRVLELYPNHPRREHFLDRLRQVGH